MNFGSKQGFWKLTAKFQGSLLCSCGMFSMCSWSREFFVTFAHCCLTFTKISSYHLRNLSLIWLSTSMWHLHDALCDTWYMIMSSTTQLSGWEHKTLPSCPFIGHIRDLVIPKVRWLFVAGESVKVHAGMSLQWRSHIFTTSSCKHYQDSSSA